MLDCCEAAGAIREEQMRTPGRRFLGRPPLTILASCGAQELSYGTTDEGGIFTRCLAEGLRQGGKAPEPRPPLADRNQDRVIDLEELQAYLMQSVPGLVAKINHGGGELVTQTPVLWESGKRELPLIRIQPGSRRSSPLPIKER